MALNGQSDEPIHFQSESANKSCAQIKTSVKHFCVTNRKSAFWGDDAQQPIRRAHLLWKRIRQWELRAKQMLCVFAWWIGTVRFSVMTLISQWELRSYSKNNCWAVLHDGAQQPIRRAHSLSVWICQKHRRTFFIHITFWAVDHFSMRRKVAK